MPASSFAYSTSSLHVYFLSQRAHIDDQVVDHLVRFIGGAKKSLDCAIYDFKHPLILGAMKQASSKVRLRIAYDAGNKKKTITGGGSVDPKFPGTAQCLADYGLTKFSTPVDVVGNHLMHSKFIVRDGKSVWTGSGNFTHGGLELQDNNFLVINSAGLAGTYTSVFEDLLTPNHTQHHSQQPAGAPLFAGAAQPVRVGSLTITPFFSVGHGETEEVDTAVVNALAGAKKVRVMAMLISDPETLQALAAFKGPSRDIRGVLDPHEMKMVMKQSNVGKQQPELFWFAQGDKRFVAAPSHAVSPQNAGLDNHDLMHQKVMILDDHLVISGSYNFSENAEKNDENLLLIDSRRVAAAYNKYFEALFAEYKQHGAPLPPA
jgi:phosphatidylserine/phosphatidylglycerophosphate/cardiolipin synthase-like enzyme